MRRVLLLSLSVVGSRASSCSCSRSTHRWQEQVVADDASFRAFPLTEDVWQPSTILPASLVSSTAGAGDEHTATACARSSARPARRGVPGARAGGVAGGAQIVLTELFRHEQDPVRRAHIGTLGAPPRSHRSRTSSSA